MRIAPLIGVELNRGPDIGGPMSEHFLLGILVVIAAVINLYGLMIVRDVHKLTNETLLKVNVTMDFVSKRQ